MFKPSNNHSVEILEARIAPATVVPPFVAPTVADAERAFDLNPINDTHFVTASHGSPILLKAGQVLTTGAGARSGTYLMIVEKGQMMVFLTDLNNNKEVDYNEITGIAAGDGLRFTSFVDIHGSIVTNLDSDTTLSDSNNDSSDNDPFLKGDGLILNNSRIESINMRSLTLLDLTDQNSDGVVDDLDIETRLALTSHSIHGQVLAGKGFGLVGDLTSGLRVDDSGRTFQENDFDVRGVDWFIPFKPTIGAIRTGTAAGGEYFSFGISAGDDIQGTLRSFLPPAGQAGGDIFNVRGNTATPFNVSGLSAGDGGFGARGGNIQNVTFNSDTASGYQLVAGNGGRGPSGGDGGSILNFSDLGSVTGQILVKVGDGGLGTTGSGGNGGGLGFDPIVVPPDPNAPPPVTTGDPTPAVNINVNGGLEIVMGDGGVGFKAGGNGASLSKAVITVPEGTAEFGRAVVATTHDGKHDPISGKLIRQGVIGRTIPVDIDEDGVGDVVFTTSEAEQLVVQFGDPALGFKIDPITARPIRIYLDGPSGAEALAVGDFNGDGHQDIVVASSDADNFAGFTVFLAKWEDADANGLSPAEDANRNGVDDFLGFYSGRTSPLPSLAKGDPDGSPILDRFYVYRRSANPINDIAVGDFDGDGYTDVAVSATYITRGAPPGVAQIVIVMSPDIEDGRPTGQFFADVGQKAQAQPPIGANPFQPFIRIGDSVNGRIEATALSGVATHDVIIAAPVVGTTDLNGVSGTTILNGLVILDFSLKSIFGPLVGGVSWDLVDTNRALAPLPAITLEPAFGRDFAVVDFNEDGKADFVGIMESPEGFLVAAEGTDGLGNTRIVTQNPGSPDQNRGFFFGPRGMGLETQEFAIRATDIPLGDDPTIVDDVAVLDLGVSADGRNYLIIELSIWDLNAQATTLIVPNPGVDATSLVVNTLLSTPSGADTSVVGFDTHYLDATTTAAARYATARPLKAAGGTIDSRTFLGGNPSIFVTPEAEHFIHITGGDGGDGIIGRGGAGGFLGGNLSLLDLVDAQGLLTPTLFGALDITLPENVAFSGDVRLTGGAGGDGFTTGGTGGGVLGASVRYVPSTQTFHSNVYLRGGQGGFGVAGAGGDGGSLVAGSLETGVLLIAGDGGRGATGGSGGSIVGHGFREFTDNREPFQQLFAGNGAEGVTRGGNGGSIRDYHGLFNLAFLGRSAGIIVYVAGDAGGAVKGPGGSGGDVINTSPFIFGESENLMSGDVFLRAGRGGNGLSGGRGGSVDTFVNAPSEQDAPAVLSFLAGDGGNGTKGNGGPGGHVRNINTPSKGTPSSGEPAPIDGQPVTIGGEAISTRATVFTYNRIIAGRGGNSAGGTGGDGGSVSNVISSNVDDPFVVAAGAAGSGLRVGGSGGGVSNVRLDIGGGSLAKALVIAGAGGSASAFVANPLDPAANQAEKAFGGQVGRGGHGGSIKNFTQQGGIGVHSDLIAGNGGDTLFYGSIADSTTFVGRGGSIEGITVAGNVGNVLGTIPIKSYNDLRRGQTVADFIESSLLDRFSGGAIGDDVGNVGAVVGSAGRLKPVFVGFNADNDPIFQSLPARNGINGDFNQVTARNILSAVAGSVDRIASIRAVHDVSVIATGRVGTDKTLVPESYLDKIGNSVIEPLVDGGLVDGALVSSTQPTRTSGGKKIAANLAGNVFVLP